MHLANALLPRVTPSGALDSLGCTSGLLTHSEELRGRDITFYRKRSDSSGLRQVSTLASDRGVLVGVSMRVGHCRRIFHEHHASSHDFDTQSIYLRDFAEDYHADLKGPFDFLLMEVSHDAIARAAAERPGAARPHRFAPVAAVQDPVLVHLAHALAPALARPGDASALFIDQMGAVISTWLVGNYLGESRSRRAARRGQRLSRQHETRAKDLLREHLDGNITVSDVAEACGLSRSYFIRAFRETTGQTPHQWLLAQRVALARELLAGSALPLVDVAAACGFADQSHFTRVFTQAVGAPPGQWRRDRLN